MPRRETWTPENHAGETQSGRKPFGQTDHQGSVDAHSARIMEDAHLKVVETPVDEKLRQVKEAHRHSIAKQHALLFLAMAAIALAFALFVYIFNL